MNITIHRGSKEIGGTCIQVSTEKTTILLDLGSPLSEQSGNLSPAELKFDAVLVSHPHQDHYGLIEEADAEIPVYIGKVGKSLIDASRLFIGRGLLANQFRFIERNLPFAVGDITITPYLVDHSAVDAYAFLIEAEGKRLFYSGDFRAHGRKSVLFDRLIQNPPKDIDVLFMEGTMMQRSNDQFPDEQTVEELIVEIIRDQKTISFLIASSQNIDRVVSAYRACLDTGKTLVVDIYTAWVLEQIKMISTSVPRLGWDQVRLYAKAGHKKTLAANSGIFGDFNRRGYPFRISMDELLENPANYLVLGKMSSFKDIETFRGNIPVNLIYSQWLGYLNQESRGQFGAAEMAGFRNDKEINFHYAHTSGHATVEDLQTFSRSLNPKRLVPVHTEYGEQYEGLFSNVLLLQDGECFVCND